MLINANLTALIRSLLGSENEAITVAQWTPLARILLMPNIYLFHNWQQNCLATSMHLTSKDSTYHNDIPSRILIEAPNLQLPDI